MIIEEPIPQSNESVPASWLKTKWRQECCLKSSGLLGFEEILSLNGPKLKVGQKLRVVVAAAVNPRLFYCRLSSMSKDLQEMSKKLAHACESGCGSLSSKPLENLGLLCAVKGKDENGTEDLCNVSLSTLRSELCLSTVAIVNRWKLKTSFSYHQNSSQTPIMAFPCSLSCLEEQEETIKNQQLKLLKTGLLGKALQVDINDFHKDQNFYLVTLSTAEKHSEEQAKVIPLESEVLDSKSNFLQNVLEKMYATESKAVQTSDTVPSRSNTWQFSFWGVCAACPEPKHFWIRTKEQNPDLKGMTEEIKDYCNKLQLNEEVLKTQCLVHFAVQCLKQTCITTGPL